MDRFMAFNTVALLPAALIGVVIAIVLLVLRRKKNGERPKHEKGFLVAAILLFVFAAVVVIVNPMIYLIYLLVTSARLSAGLIFAGFKSF